MKLLFKRSCLLLLCLCLLIGCSATEDANAPELKTPVSLNPDSAFAEYGSVFDLTYYLGIIYADSEAASFPRSGVIQSIDIEYGQTVQKGDVLAQLDASAVLKQIEDCRSNINSQREQFNANNRKQQISLELLQMELTNLQNSGASSYKIESKKIEIERKQLDIRRTQESQQRTLNSLNQTLTTLEASLADFTLTAPCDGTVVWFSTKAAVGTSVGANSTLFQVADLNSLYIQTEYITDKTLDATSRIYARIDNKDYELVPGEVDEDDRLSSMISGTALTTFFRFAGESDPKHFGTAAMVCLYSNQKDNVLCIPSNAVFTDAGGTYVYRIENNQRVKTYITIGIVTTLRTEILDGIQEGDEIYVQG